MAKKKLIIGAAAAAGLIILAAALSPYIIGAVVKRSINKAVIQFNRSDYPLKIALQDYRQGYWYSSAKLIISDKQIIPITISHGFSGTVIKGDLKTQNLQMEGYFEASIPLTGGKMHGVFKADKFVYQDQLFGAMPVIEWDMNTSHPDSFKATFYSENVNFKNKKWGKIDVKEITLHLTGKNMSTGWLLTPKFILTQVKLQSDPIEVTAKCLVFGPIQYHPAKITGLPHSKIVLSDVNIATPFGSINASMKKTAKFPMGTITALDIVKSVLHTLTFSSKELKVPLGEGQKIKLINVNLTSTIDHGDAALAIHLPEIIYKNNRQKYSLKNIQIKVSYPWRKLELSITDKTKFINQVLSLLISGFIDIKTKVSANLLLTVLADVPSNRVKDTPQQFLQEFIKSGLIQKNKAGNIDFNLSFSVKGFALNGRSFSLYQFGRLLLQLNAFDEAYSAFYKASLKNNADALYYLGAMTFYGLGHTKDQPKGIQLIQKAADLGSPKAAALLKQEIQISRKK